jgi:hypothetical protein
MVLLNAFNRMSYLLIFITLLALVLYATGARADDDGPSMFSFNGFGTLGVAHSSEDRADFTASIFKPDGTGHSHAWSFDVDSLIAGQVSVSFTPKLSAVVQAIVEQNYDGSYTPHVEWANIKYQFTPDFSVRVGRTVLPTLLFSDTRKVAYTYPWVRLPLEVYHNAPITASDGVDATYQIHVGGFTDVLQAHFGESDTKLPAGNGTVKARQSWGLVSTGEYHGATLHIGYESTHMTINSLNTLFDAFRQFGTEGIAIADKYDIDNKHVYVITLGARYDPGKWFVLGEWSHVVTHSVLGTLNGWYVSGGYRFGKFTPYVAYAQATADNLSDPGLTVSALPPFLAGPAAGLNAALNSLLSTKPVQDTISIGARWDFMKNVALKLQFDHTDIGAGSTGTLINIQPGFQPGGAFNVFSASIDFVF